MDFDNVCYFKCGIQIVKTNSKETPTVYHSDTPYCRGETFPSKIENQDDILATFTPICFWHWFQNSLDSHSFNSHGITHNDALKFSTTEF